jgi:hypothetical protein
LLPLQQKHDHFPLTFFSPILIIYKLLDWCIYIGRCPFWLDVYNSFYYRWLNYVGLTKGKNHPSTRIGLLTWEVRDQGECKWWKTTMVNLSESSKNRSYMWMLRSVSILYQSVHRRITFLRIHASVYKSVLGSPLQYHHPLSWKELSLSPTINLNGPWMFLNVLITVSPMS